MGSFKVAAIQMNCVLGNKDENLRRAEDLIIKAVSQGAKLIIVPELFNTGYRVEEIDYELAEDFPGTTIKWMTSLCEEHNIFIIGSLLEKSNIRGLVYNTAVVTGANGIIGKYRKQKLWDAEKNRFLKGEGNQIVDLGFVKVGLQICYEIGFPEPSRSLTLEGADILVFPSAFGKARDYAWDLSSRSRALENGVYVIASNRTGTEKEETVFAGMSRIIDPKGAIISSAMEENDVIVSEIHLNRISEQRNLIPYLRDLETIK
jgi:predicted amidohydrolase